MAIKQGEVKKVEQSAIDERKLVDLMLQWEDHINQAAELEQQIADITFIKQQTTKVGHVSASYFIETYVFDYESAGTLNASPEIKDKYSKVTCVTDYKAIVEHLLPDVEERELKELAFSEYKVAYDWKAICKEANLQPAIIDKKPARVIVKLV